MASTPLFDPQVLAQGAEALLREHPDALVAGLASNGLIVPVPNTVGLWGQGLIEGRAVFDNVVAADRNTVTRLWIAMREQGSVSDKVRLIVRPESWMTLHFIDLRDVHGVVLAVLLPSDDVGEDGEPLEELKPAALRYCTLTEDEAACVLDCDDAFTEMFGFTLEEMYGKSVIDQIHPDDQGRAVEGWLTLLSTGRNQHTRLRRKHKDGAWLWVDTTLHNFLNEPGRNHVLVEFIDASAEMQAQEALADREELLRRLTNAMPVGLLHIDVERNVVYHNARLLSILHGETEADEPDGADDEPVEPADGTAEQDGHGHATPLPALLATLTPQARTDFENALAEVLGDGVDRDIELDLILPNGCERRVLMSLRALLRRDDGVSGAITCVLDVTDSARARRELERRATFDVLTGCHNRAAILSELDRELERTDSAATGVVYVDLDRFKPVNDRLGHAAGDELLRLVAERLRVASRDADLIGRLGGDEFLVVLSNITGPDVAMSVAERVCRSIAGPFELSCGTVKVGASAGVAYANSGTTDGEELIRRADAAMYESKSERRGCPVMAPSSALL